MSFAPGTTELTPPSSALYGAQKLVAAQAQDELLSQLRNLAWRPSYLNNPSNWVTRYSPEAVLTQGWGSEFDLAIVAEQLLARGGFSPQRTWAVLTEEGRQALRDYIKYEPPEEGDKKLPFSDMGCRPALFYRDAGGTGQVMVVPFMKELKTLEGYAYLNSADGGVPGTEYPEATVKVVVEAVPISERAKNGGSGLGLGGDLFGSFGGELAGGEEPPQEAEAQELTILEESFKLTDLSMSAVDVGFALADDRAWMAWADTSLGRKQGSIWWQWIIRAFLFRMDDELFAFGAKMIANHGSLCYNLLR